MVIVKHKDQVIVKHKDAEGWGWGVIRMHHVSLRDISPAMNNLNPLSLIWAASLSSDIIMWTCAERDISRI